MKKKLPKMSVKRKNWNVTFFDEGQKFGPFGIAHPYPISDIEAAMYALRGANGKKGFSLNVRFKAKAMR